MRVISKACLICVVSAAIIIAAFVGTFSVSAQAETLSGEGDVFRLSDREFTVNESFVFSATVTFENGNAAGLVFGATEDEIYWVYNIDRCENHVKLLVFTSTEQGLHAEELLVAPFIGNDKMTESERELVDPKVAAVDRVQLKIVVSPSEDGAVAKFYADGMRRFDFDAPIALDSLAGAPADGYTGGRLGYNCFHAQVTFEDVHVAESDDSNYTELYRNQFHFSQYAHWNNDPNGLVYYDGWYHLYFQHHPYSNYWSDMYWGHARSRDLVHWEQLPICLFPDGEGSSIGGSDAGYMWSGSAFVYHIGDSAAVDEQNWYPAGSGSGLIAFYTRDGARQDQGIMTSDDGGLTWTKRKLISQESITGIADVKTDCRDPKVFSIEKDTTGKTTRWGMAVSGYALNKIWFMQSTDLLNWSAAGSFTASAVECPDVAFLTAGNGKQFAVMTFSARKYVVGTLTWESGRIVFRDAGGIEVSDADALMQTMDYGPDSYATQTFYIDDEASEFYGDTISVSWFSGVPNAPASIESGSLSAARKIWNGGGMTIPVKWGLAQRGEGYELTQTPIVLNSEGFSEQKQQIVSFENKIMKGSSSAMSAVNTHTFELIATIENPLHGDVYFRINAGETEYVEIGWNKTEGYYVDRSRADDAGLGLPNYRVRYHSGERTGDTQTFYVLSDEGGIEVFCDEYSVPFYVLTFSYPSSRSTELYTTEQVNASVTVNEIASVWRENSASGKLYVETDAIELDMGLTPTRIVRAYCADGILEWEIKEGSDVVSIELAAYGAAITAIRAGSAMIAVKSQTEEAFISVTVYEGKPDSDIDFAPDGILSGHWYMTENGLKGVQSAGDGFLLSETKGSDFTLAATFSLEGAAAAIVFRANADMSDYLIANYDNNGKIVKLWSPRGEIANVAVTQPVLDGMTLKVRATGRNICVWLNGVLAIEATLDETDPTDGFFGLNACAGTVVFKSIVLLSDSYVYGGTGNLTVQCDTQQSIVAIFNRTLQNTLVDRSFYEVDGRSLELSEAYFETLRSAGVYEFVVNGSISSFEFSVDAQTLPSVAVEDLSIDEGCAANIFLGGLAVTSVKVNGEDVRVYSYRNGILGLNSGLFSVGDNRVTINGTLELTVTVTAIGTVFLVPEKQQIWPIAVGISFGIVAAAGLTVGLILILRRRKKHGADN